MCVCVRASLRVFVLLAEETGAWSNAGEGSLGKDCSGGMNNASMHMADLAELEREKEKSDTHQMSD